MMRVIGNHVSPYARKVFVALAMKGLAFEVDPIIPFFGGDAFTALSPLRRIPVLVDGGLVVNDSTVICEYLDEIAPAPPLYPANPADRARARWLEEYADSRLGDIIVWRLFGQRLIGPRVLRRPTDEAVVARALADLAGVLDWLEPQTPAAGFLFGEQAMLADVTFGCFFRNAALVGEAIDAARWPRAAGWIARVQALPEFAATIPFEQAMLTSRRPEQRAALAALGLPVAAETVGSEEARAGTMST